MHNTFLSDIRGNTVDSDAWRFLSLRTTSGAGRAGRGNHDRVKSNTSTPPDLSYSQRIQTFGKLLILLSHVFKL